MFEESFRALPLMAMRLKDAAIRGQIRGTRGIANWFRKPYGPGWVLTGDAGHLKDSSTGFGIRDALIQSFLLSETLDTILDGGDWQNCLSEFERKRNRMMLPSFEATIAYSQLHDADPEELPWLRGVLANPHLCRSFMQWIAGTLSHSSPTHLETEIRRMAVLFGAKPRSGTTSIELISSKKPG